MSSLAQRVATELAAVDGVVAVTLGGSWARGWGDAGSDVDLGIYYQPDLPIDIPHLRAVARRLDDRATDASLVDPGGWGPWINGGAWLVIQGRRVDWIYRDLGLVGQIVDECVAGRPRLHYQPGHPHAFATHIYAGEVALGRSLHDPGGRIDRLRTRCQPYPPALADAVVGWLWEARFALETAAKAADRGDVAYVAGCAFRCVAVVLHVLYALNRRWWLNEKGALAQAETFPLVPAGTLESLRDVLACTGGDAGALRRSLDALGDAVTAVSGLATTTT